MNVLDDVFKIPLSHFLRSLLPALLGLLLLWSPVAAQQHTGEPVVAELRRDFLQFLPGYVREVYAGNAAYLAEIHPELPRELYDFFFEATRAMMDHAERSGLDPEVTCREYGSCKVTWPQPDGSWAAQSFIRHQGRWRWLSP